MYSANILRLESANIFFMSSLQGPRGLPGAFIKKIRVSRGLKSDRVFQVSVVSRTGFSGIVIDMLGYGVEGPS